MAFKIKTVLFSTLVLVLCSALPTAVFAVSGMAEIGQVSIGQMNLGSRSESYSSGLNWAESRWTSVYVASEEGSSLTLPYSANQRNLVWLEVLVPQRNFDCEYQFSFQATRSLIDFDNNDVVLKMNSFADGNGRRVGSEGAAEIVYGEGSGANPSVSLQTAVTIPANSGEYYIHAYLDFYSVSEFSDYFADYFATESDAGHWDAVSNNLLEDPTVTISRSCEIGRSASSGSSLK